MLFGFCNVQASSRDGAAGAVGILYQASGGTCASLRTALRDRLARGDWMEELAREDRNDDRNDDRKYDDRSEQTSRGFDLCAQTASSLSLSFLSSCVARVRVSPRRAAEGLYIYIRNGGKATQEIYLAQGKNTLVSFRSSEDECESPVRVVQTMRTLSPAKMP